LRNINFVNEIAENRPKPRSVEAASSDQNFHNIYAISTKIMPSNPIAFRAIESIFQFNGGAILQKERADKSHRRTGSGARKSAGKGTPRRTGSGTR
jgi:hypothetical protein